MRRKSLTVISILLLLLVVVVAAVRLAHNLGSPNGPQGPTGTVTGVLQAVGGPGDVGPRALSGQVTLHGPGGHKTGISVGANGRFSAPVSVGRYTVSGRSPQYEGGKGVCRAAEPVTVTKGVTTKVRIKCPQR